MIYKYTKITDEYTTYTVIFPQDSEGNQIGTELVTINEETYFHIPDTEALPEQSEQISVEVVTLTDELKKEIKAISPHVQLSYKRLRERIRSKYDIEDEQYLTRISVGNLMGAYELLEGESDLIAEYQAWVEECREIARLERVALGLG
jgi:hypothetical protein